MMAASNDSDITYRHGAHTQQPIGMEQQKQTEYHYHDDCNDQGLILIKFR